MKRILTLVLTCIICALCLSGCSHSKKEVLKFSSWGSQSEVAILKPLLDEFENENPDIEIEFMHAPAHYFSKLHLYFAAKMEPDVIFLNNLIFPKYLEADLFEDLTPYFKDEIKNETFFKNTIDAFSKDGKVYAIPRDISNVVIYYNKNVFDKLHLSYPKENWTVDELYELSKKLTLDTNKDGVTDIWGINRSNKMIYWQPFLTVEGEKVLDKDGYLAINSQNSIKILQRYAELVTRDLAAPPDNVLAGKTYAQMFMNGELAFFAGGRWNMPQFSRIKDFEWDVINFPQSKTSFIPADASGWAVAKRSKSKENAVKLVKFLSSNHSIAKFTKSGLITPARKDIAQSDSFLNNPKNKNNQAFLYATQHSKPQKLNGNIKEMEDILLRALEPAFNGNETVEKIMHNKALIQDLCDLSKCK